MIQAEKLKIKLRGAFNKIRRYFCAFLIASKTSSSFGRSKLKDLNFVISNFAVLINHNHATRRTSGKPRFHFIFFKRRAFFIRKKRQRQIIFSRKIFVRFSRIRRNSHNFRAGFLIIFPIITNGTQLFCANRRIVARIKQQNDGFPALF